MRRSTCQRSAGGSHFILRAEHLVVAHWPASTWLNSEAASRSSLPSGAMDPNRVTPGEGAVTVL
jgi:hypothetical protein